MSYRLSRLNAKTIPVFCFVFLYFFFKVFLSYWLSKIFFPSGPGCRTGPPGSVFQRRPVLHSRLSHLRGGAHIWWVCSKERWESQEEDSWQPLWSHDWAGSTGEVNTSKTPQQKFCSVVISGLIFSFSLFVLGSHFMSVFLLYRSVGSSRIACWSLSRVASVKEPSWSVEAKLWAWKGSSLSPQFSLTWGMRCASPKRRYKDKGLGLL